MGGEPGPLGDGFRTEVTRPDAQLSLWRAGAAGKRVVTTLTQGKGARVPAMLEGVPQAARSKSCGPKSATESLHYPIKAPDLPSARSRCNRGAPRCGSCCRRASLLMRRRGRLGPGSALTPRGDQDAGPPIGERVVSSPPRAGPRV
ncbi:hypothetical protein NDU88_006024 [Pleurodeles waltl]|uniref:Uncharacterized protein n=1 Tax=Pleurodeles waltl TaxID=8319 RepID=A0AAV7NTY3_PLEWA|nr:hypothetical protein NDU88_006024 [Pleurodeles waltl]